MNSTIRTVTPAGFLPSATATRSRLSVAGVLAVLVPLSLVAADALASTVGPGPDILVGLCLIGILGVVARLAGLRLDDLGLARSTWAAGLRWGLGVAALVGTGYAAAPAITPAARFRGRGRRPDVVRRDGQRGDPDPARHGHPRGVRVPWAAVRGVAPAERPAGRGARLVGGVRVLAHRARPRGRPDERRHGRRGRRRFRRHRAAAGGHGAGHRAERRGAVRAAVRSGSLLAPILLHWALNAGGVLFVLLA